MKRPALPSPVRNNFAMLEIRINNEPLDLPAGFSVELEDTNPIFNERGSQSVPATVPATPVNERLLAFPTRIDAGEDPNQPERVAIVSDGAYVRRGLVNVTTAGVAEGITFNVGFDNSTAYNRWSNKKLSELSTLPTIQGDDVGFPNGVEGILDYLYTLYSRPEPDRDPLAIFPVAIGNESVQVDSETKIYWEVLNAPNNSGTGLRPLNRVKRVIDGVVTDVTVPDGYCVTPFLRVWKLLELVFADIGVTIVSNVFRTDPEFNRLVVLNNAADAVCVGLIRYADLVPDCTVSEFLNALWVRFGLTYNINFDTKRATLRLLRDILAAPASLDMVKLSTGSELINYEARQYVKLSAKTSLEGAAPATERFEDFVKGLDIRGVHLGVHVSQWTFIDNGNGGCWDGDVRDDYYSAKAAAPAAQAETSTASTSNTFLAREFITGTWYKLDSNNKTVRASSSSFFNWDPATPDLDALDLTSDDECVPIMRVDTVGLGTGNYFNDKCPAYLTGARHYHSYIKSSECAEGTGESTPLAFCIAYNIGGKTFGRINPEGDDGRPLTMDDGSHPTLSLLFQFKDGLFAQFWASYDEILRHGNRSVEVPAMIDKIDFLKLDTLEPVVFRGIRCLIDTLTYQLPTGKDIRADLKLRTISTHGNYNIKTEQNVPDFSAAARHLEWFLKSETFSEDMLTAIANKVEAARKYRNDNNYQPHGVEGDFYDVTAAGAIPKSITRAYPTWQTDTTKPTPGAPENLNTRKYKALLTYEIYEVHDMSYQGGPEDYELDKTPLGEVTITVEYTVQLIARWVND